MTISFSKTGDALKVGASSSNRTDNFKATSSPAKEFPYDEPGFCFVPHGSCDAEPDEGRNAITAAALVNRSLRQPHPMER
jgi:hypothetical protein